MISLCNYSTYVLFITRNQGAILEVEMMFNRIRPVASVASRLNVTTAKKDAHRKFFSTKKTFVQ